MNEIFHDVSSIDYPVIDADAHVNEPPDLWQRTIGAEFKCQADVHDVEIRSFRRIRCPVQIAFEVF